MQPLISGVTLWIAISSGLGLWSLTISVGVSVFWSYIFLFGRFRNFVFSLFARGEIAAEIDWRSQIWPVRSAHRGHLADGHIRGSVIRPNPFLF